ncbi:hypothetical protein [Candidatus Enterococcus clewellii]|uniref:hypothetical protein n=1 Tax=Candidatus Enterococcus clewellii TaxID=1834193 RepID=UPI000A34359F|nr:hypothetical protein [Enterococcus sp. 9E7_DIV0242]
MKIIVDELKELFREKHHTYKQKYNLRLELTKDFSRGAIRAINDIYWLPKAIVEDIFLKKIL